MKNVYPLVVGLLAFTMASCSPQSDMKSAEQTRSTASPYVGFESREIKSLSQGDIQELHRGGGWGLALAAELNGMPGPAHLLEFKKELNLSPEQISKISALFTEMKAEAILAGDVFIKAEIALDAAFLTGNLDAVLLEKLVTEAADARASLRFIHLSRHLSTPSLLSAEQIEKYAELRGYSGDACATTPEGHNAAMWRRHNNCD